LSMNEMITAPAVSRVAAETSAVLSASILDSGARIIWIVTTRLHQIHHVVCYARLY
jgi:hypothetical protein